MKSNENYTWHFLRHYVIRSTGFPFEWMEELSFLETEACLAHVTEVEQRVHQWAARLPTLWPSVPLTPELRRARQQIERRAGRYESEVLRGLSISPPSLCSTLEQWAREWSTRITTYQFACEQARRTFEREMEAKRARLRRIVADPAYQQAVFLSSPDMYHHHIPGYLARGEIAKRTSEIRRIERRFFSYLQRFCGKNETASFFGPLNYGQISHTADVFLNTHMHGDPLTGQREVFLTFWAVKALAETLQEDISLKEELPLHVHPMAELRDDGTMYLHAHKRTLTIGKSLEKAFRAIDGTKGTSQILSSLPEAERQRAKDLLETLIRIGAIRRGFQIPSTTAYPLCALSAQLRQLPLSASRRTWEERLERWENWCKRMARTGFPERVQLLQEGEATFTEQTHRPARRGSGDMYADRYIFYEEARGHIEQFVMGPAFHEKLCRDLRGSLELSAVQGYHEWNYMQQHGRELFAALSPGREPIPFFQFIQELRKTYPDILEIPPAPQRVAIEDLIARKAAQGNAHRVCLSSQELPLLEPESACYSLPDLFFSATSLQALQRGEFQVVLGKLHHHLLVPGWMTCLYPDVKPLRAEVSRYLQDVPAFRSLACPEVVRRNKGFYDFPGRVIEFSEHALRPGEEIIPLYDLLVVLHSSGTLGLVRKSTGEPVTLYISLADQVRYLPFALFALPGLSQMTLSTGSHTPRVEIDGVVYQRERWAFPSAVWQNLLRGDDFAKFLQVYRFKQEQGLPEWVYVRGSSERKPYLVDFRNFLCLELLCSVVTKNDHLLFEEMLPAPDQLWLRSPQGRYSCEFRMSVLRTAVHC